MMMMKRINGVLVVPLAFMLLASGCESIGGALSGVFGGFSGGGAAQESTPQQGGSTAAAAEAEKKAEEAARKAEAERRAKLPVTEDDFEIVQNRQGTVTITRYTGLATRVPVPAAISGLRVTELGAAFQGNRDIVAITIPETITAIPDNAFRGCVELKELVLPAALKTIGSGAFAGCGISSLTIPAGLTVIGESAFAANAQTEGDSAPNKNVLQSLVIPDTVLEIGAYAFKDCGIQSLRLGRRLTTIGAEAFRGNDIQSLVIPDAVTTLGASAFRDCGIEILQLGRGLTAIEQRTFSNNKITALTIPAFVTLVSPNAFTGNPLTGITIPASLAAYSPGVRGFENAFVGTSPVHVVLPSNVAEENLDQFGESLINFWISQGRKAGTYVRNGRVWTFE
jgi:hypothetical protein